MPRSYPLASTAGYAHRLHGGFDGRQYGWSRHDETGHNHLFDCAVPVAFLICVQNEPKVPIAKVFGVCKSRNENIRHNGRFAQQHPHAFLPNRLLLFVLAGPRAISKRLFGQLANQILARAFVTIHSPKAPSHHGFQAVNAEWRA